MDIVVDNPSRTRRGGDVGEATFPDIPGFVQARWERGHLRVTFDRDLTAVEHQKVLDRVQSLTVDEEQTRSAARAYLSLTRPPTALENFEQVKRLTRLLLGDYDGSA